MRRLIFYILITVTVIQCDWISPDVYYSRELEKAFISDLELVEPFIFRSDSFTVPAAYFQVTGETGAIYDVEYEVFGSIWFCDGTQNPVEIIADRVLIADKISISSDRVHLGAGYKGLTVASNTNKLSPGSQWFPSGIGLRIYYRNDEGKKQITQRESYGNLDWMCK